MLPCFMNWVLLSANSCLKTVQNLSLADFPASLPFALDELFSRLGHEFIAGMFECYVSQWS